MIVNFKNLFSHYFFCEIIYSYNNNDAKYSADTSNLIFIPELRVHGYTCMAGEQRVKDFFLVIQKFGDYY